MSTCVTTFPPNPAASSSTSVISTHRVNKPQAASFRRLHHTDVSLRVANERTEASPDVRSEADKIVDGMDFGELCDEFECISSPLVESTARQLVRDILELREGNRALGSYAVSVKYKSVQQMVMLSTSLLNIKWTLRGKPKSPIITFGGDLILKVDSKFTMNQISGQVIEHEETWNPSQSHPLTQAYFWASRQLFATVEAGKDVSDSIRDVSKQFAKENKNIEMYPDPTGDPTKCTRCHNKARTCRYNVSESSAISQLQEEANRFRRERSTKREEQERTFNTRNRAKPSSIISSRMQNQHQQLL